jgi:hypothetical protein
MKAIRTIVIAATLLGSMAFAQEAKSPAHLDGGWWKAKSELYREAWISGYKSGLHQGEGHDTELTKFGTVALLDGTNKFYADFRNRNINVHEALPFVADQLSGISDEKLNAELLKLRAAAVAGSPAE